MIPLLNNFDQIESKEYANIPEAEIDKAFIYIVNPENPKDQRDRVLLVLHHLTLVLLQDSDTSTSSRAKKLEQRVRNLKEESNALNQMVQSKTEELNALRQTVQSQREQIAKGSQELQAANRNLREHDLSLIDREIRLYEPVIQVEETGKSLVSLVLIVTNVAGVITRGFIPSVGLFLLSLPFCFVSSNTVRYLHQIAENNMKDVLEGASSVDRLREEINSATLFEHAHQSVRYWKQIKQIMIERGCSREEAKAQIPPGTFGIQKV